VFLTPAQLAMLLEGILTGGKSTAYVTDYVVGLFILVDAE
jgi:hypothetical protein